ncbi:MAG: hypothetical protein QOD95_2918 [Gammaproteobacteria bacterium]|nr:hypothetical protein [Gammaproteobacteria bacterium]
MNAGLFHIESTWLADRPAKTAVKYFGSRLVWLAVITITGLGAWILVSHYAGNDVTGKSVSRADHPAVAAASSPDPGLAQDAFNPAAAPAPVDGLKISSQSWRRGGLGSKALITFTLRNDNDYAVGDIGLRCAFSRRDGSPVTERRQTIHDTVKMKGRKTFVQVHVGFVNVTAEQAKCSLLSASRV